MYTYLIEYSGNRNTWKAKAMLFMRRHVSPHRFSCIWFDQWKGGSLAIRKSWKPKPQNI